MLRLAFFCMIAGLQPAMARQTSSGPGTTPMRLNPEKLAQMRVLEANDLFTSQVIDGNFTHDTPANHKRHWREVHSTIGPLSGSPKRQHFKLGLDTEAGVTVHWPNVDIARFPGRKSNTGYVTVQGKTVPIRQEAAGRNHSVRKHANASPIGR